MASYDTWKTTDPSLSTLGSSCPENFWCMDCDTLFSDERACPYCGSKNFDVADDIDPYADGRDFTPPYEP